MSEGRIVRSGGKELALELESRGYDWLKAAKAESPWTRTEMNGGDETMSTENDSIAIDRDIGNFFYNVTATRDAGVGLTEKTIDYIVDVKGEPEWLRAIP